MVCKVIKVNTETLTKLEELASKHSLENKEIIEKAVHDYWQKLCVEKSLVTFETIDNLQVVPKKEYRKIVKNIIGAEGPYQVEGLYKSWLGISEGMYKLSSTSLPACWFEPKKSGLNKMATVAFICASVIQSGVLLFLLI